LICVLFEYGFEYAFIISTMEIGENERESDDSLCSKQAKGFILENKE